MASFDLAKMVFVKSIFELGLITDENQTIESIITNTQIEDARYISDEINESIKDSDVHQNPGFLATQLKERRKHE